MALDEDSTDSNTPIDERIFSLVSALPTFVFKDVRGLFPQESDKTLYRALNKLEAAGRIRFLHWNRKQKVFTCLGVSTFPIFSRPGRDSFDLATVFRSMADNHDSAGKPKVLDPLRDMYINMARLFLVIDSETDMELKEQYITIHQNLVEYKRKLLLLVSDIDAVLMHASMRGDMKYFKAVFASSEAPTAEEKLAFKRWLSGVYNERNKAE